MLSVNLSVNVSVCVVQDLNSQLDKAESDLAAAHNKEKDLERLLGQTKEELTKVTDTHQQIQPCLS